MASISPRLVNVTVDDTFGDPNTGSIPEYSPSSATTLWNEGSSAENCNCNIGPSILDLTQIYKQTWHDTTNYDSADPVTITVRFTGSAVYVFNVLPNTLPYTATAAHISFSIDGEDVGLFTHSPNAGTTILYNQLVHNSTALQYGPHTLTMTVGNGSLILFDYLVYTTQGDDGVTSTSTPNHVPQSSALDSDAPASPSHTPVGAIVGAVLGGIALLLGAAVCVFCFRRRCKRRRATPGQVRAADGGHKSSYDGPRRGERSEYHDRGGDGGLLAQPEPALSPTATISSLRSPDSEATYDPRSSASNVPQRPDSTHTSFHVTTGAASPSTANRSSKRHAALTQRLETLQRRRSVLSHQASSRRARSEVSNVRESGTGAAIRELEAEIVQLRGVLAAMINAWLDGHGGHGEYPEPLPAYVE